MLEVVFKWQFFFRFPFSLGLQESAKFGPSLRQRSTSFKVQTAISPVPFRETRMNWTITFIICLCFAFLGSIRPEIFTERKSNLQVEAFLTKGFFVLRQLILRSEMRYFSRGSFIADSREDAKMLMVITSGQVICYVIKMPSNAGMDVLSSCTFYSIV